MPRIVSLLSAWYFGLCDFPSLSSPENPLQGADRKTMCGRSYPAAAWMSAGVASRQPAGGVRPWKASNCSRSNRSSTEPGTPARRVKSRMLAASTSMPPMQRKSATNVADAGAAAVEAARAPAQAAEQVEVTDLAPVE